jgi:hypothetical protein
MYAIKENAERRKKIPLFWENGSLYRSAAVPAMKRLNTIIGMANWPTDEWPQQEKELYSLGKVRETSKFFETFGIHVEEQTVEHHLCRFVGKPMMKVHHFCVLINFGKLRVLTILLYFAATGVLTKAATQ